MKKLTFFFLLITSLGGNIIPDSGTLLNNHSVGVSGVEAIQPRERNSISVEDRQPSRPTRSSDVRIAVRSFRIFGDLKVFTEEEIQEMLSDFVGESQNMQSLDAALSAINEAYRGKGYLLAHCYFPPQDVTDGHIAIKIVEGVLDPNEGGIKVVGKNLRLDSGKISKIVRASNPSGEPINRKNLERAVLLLSDFPGVKASAKLEPGSEEGTTRVEIETSEGKMLHPWLAINNAGNRYTGSVLAEAGVALKNLTTFGDELILNYRKSLSDGAFDLGSLDYSGMLSSTGLKVGIRATRMVYELGKDFEILDAKGTANILSLYSDYPIIRSARTNLKAHASFDFAAFEDETVGIQLNESQIQTVRIGLSGDTVDLVGESGYTFGVLKLHLGEVDIKNPIAELLDQSPTGAHKQGNFKKLTFSAKRIQRMTPEILLVARISGQWADRNLDSSEKIHLGGLNGVRAYSASEGAGSSGVKLSTEAQYLFARGHRWLGDVRASVFYDWGRVRQYEDRYQIPLQTPNSYSLSGWGVALNFGKANAFQTYLAYSQRIGDNPGADPLTGYDADGTKKTNRFWFSVRISF
ncbi:MAG: hypothetical protein MI748_05975 [Opitutales bacterium]|nr:hypothetical protein [Opitutales bacterium]